MKLRNQGNYSNFQFWSDDLAQKKFLIKDAQTKCADSRDFIKSKKNCFCDNWIKRQLRMQMTVVINVLFPCSYNQSMCNSFHINEILLLIKSDDKQAPKGRIWIKQEKPKIWGENCLKNRAQQIWEFNKFNYL